jgi:hypothetical protein
MHIFRKHLNYANLTATLALVFAMGGSALAAKHYLLSSTKQISPKVLKALTCKPGKTGATGATGTTGPAGANGKEGLQGKEGLPGQSALSPLPSGQSESGDYGIYTPNTKTSGFLNTSVTFPISLAAPIPASNSIYTTTTAPVTHCSGPGHADHGFLCIYSGNRGRVIAPPLVLAFESASSTEGSGRFGFDMQWSITGEEAFDVGTYTVTAP